MTRNFSRGSMCNLVISRIFGASHDISISLNPLRGNSISSSALRGKFVIFGFFDLLGMLLESFLFIFFSSFGSIGDYFVIFWDSLGICFFANYKALDFFGG